LLNNVSQVRLIVDVCLNTSRGLIGERNKARLPSPSGHLYVFKFLNKIFGLRTSMYFRIYANLK